MTNFILIDPNEFEKEKRAFCKWFRKEILDDLAVELLRDRLVDLIITDFNHQSIRTRPNAVQKFLDLKRDEFTSTSNSLLFSSQEISIMYPSKYKAAKRCDEKFTLTLLIKLLKCCICQRDKLNLSEMTNNFGAHLEILRLIDAEMSRENRVEQIRFTSKDWIRLHRHQSTNQQPSANQLEATYGQIGDCFQVILVDASDGEEKRTTLNLDQYSLMAMFEFSLSGICKSPTQMEYFRMRMDEKFVKFNAFNKNDNCCCCCCFYSLSGWILKTNVLLFFGFLVILMLIFLLINKLIII